MNLLIEVLPTELDKLGAFLDNDHDTTGAELVTAGIREAQQMAREALQVAVRRSTELVGKL